MNWPAIKTTLLLSLLFLVVYGGCNWLTAHRQDVGTFYFEWERHIPFVPLMIVPYMSIDLFFAAAPFFCRSDRECRTLANRITAAILIAGACFLLFPLRFAFERPHVDGPLGLIFNNFRKLDQPFNQFPSLHITLRTILAIFYIGRTRGLLRLVVRVWFSLIGFSTLLTYQHHVIDVIGGFALAVLCVYLLQDEPLRLPVKCNFRIGSYYLLGTIGMIGLAVVTRPLGLLLIWPALSFALVMGAYFGLGPGIFRKRSGRLPIISRILLWPTLLGQWLSLRHYARQCEAWNALTDRVWIGRKLSDAEARRAMDQGVRAVLDLTSELSETRPLLATAYFHLPIMDLTAPTHAQLEKAIGFIDCHASTGIVYVHCKAGYSRTGAVAGAYLLATHRAQTVEQVVALLRKSRPAIVIRPEVLEALHDWKSAGTAIDAVNS